jgi:amphi-Trp domain-containing protein
MGESGKFEFAATVEAARAAEYLVRLAEGLRGGGVNLSAGESTIHLVPGTLVKLEIEAEGKPEKAQGSVAVEISWKADKVAEVPTLEVTTGPMEDPVAAASN